MKIACVASVSARVRPEKVGREQKKKGMTGEGEGKDAGYNENALQNSDSQFRKRRIALVSVVVSAEEKRNL